MAIEIVYTVEDASGDQATTQIRVAGEPTVAGLNGFGAGYATALNNIIAGIIRSAVAFLKPAFSSLTGNLIGADSDVEHIGKFEFVALNGQRVKVNVPCLAEVTIGATTSDSLDQAQVNVAAFLAAMETGIGVTGGTISPCDIGESSISDTVFAREAFKNSGARR
jgi:hypothetical protein